MDRTEGIPVTEVLARRKWRSGAGTPAGERKLALWRRDSRCFWCGRPTVLSPPNGFVPDLAATLDHLDSRLRGRNTQALGRTVLACKRCNLTRNDIELQAANGGLKKQALAEFVVRCGSGHGNDDEMQAWLAFVQGLLAGRPLQ
jgi:hypothetical protein